MWREEKALILKSKKELENDKREEGLKTELNQSNKGFAMLMKMGYKAGNNKQQICLKIKLLLFSQCYRAYGKEPLLNSRPNLVENANSNSLSSPMFRIHVKMGPFKS